MQAATTRGKTRAPALRAYTLVEVLVVVTVLGIAAALLIPVMSQTGVLKVQAAVRTVVADITAAQSDALAYQRGRALVFYPGENRYIVTEVNGATIDTDLDLLDESRFDGEDFGDADLVSVDFNADSVLIFDELGAPVTTPGGAIPAPPGTIVIRGSGQEFIVTVEGYTGRVTVQRVGDEGEEEVDGG